MWVYWICDTQSGQKDLQVEPVNGRWQRKLAGYGSGSHTFQVLGTDYPRETWRDLLNDDWSRTLVVSWQDPDVPAVDYPMYAGVITSADANADGTVTVQHSEVRVFLDVRLAHTTYSDTPFIIDNRSWRGVIAQAVFLAITGPARRALPIFFPFFDEAGSNTVTINANEFKTIEEIVTDAQKANGGPEVEFRPYWDFESKLKHELRMGNPELSGDVLEFNVSAAAPGHVSYESSSDGSKVATFVWTVGKGSGADMRHGGAALGGITPAKERVRSFKDEPDPDVLNGLALAEADAFVLPTKQPDVTVLAADAVAQGLRLGSSVRLLFDSHWWEFDGAQSYRLVGFGSDGTNKLDLQVQGA